MINQTRTIISNYKENIYIQMYFDIIWKFLHWKDYSFNFVFRESIIEFMLTKFELI